MIGDVIDYGEDWETKRKERLAIDGRCCVQCGGHAIEVHHKKYVRLRNGQLRNDVILDLESLCGPCHDVKTRRSRATRRLP